MAKTNQLTITTQLQNLLKSALTDLEIDFTDNQVHLDHPTDQNFGDYSTNIAMQIFGQLQKEKSKSKFATATLKNLQKFKNPRDLAQALADKIKQAADFDTQVISDVSIAGPGFINFTLSEHFLLQELQQFFDKKEAYGRLPLSKPKRIMAESGHPNTHKAPHIGHLFSYVVGDSLARILEYQGHEVVKVNYQGDVGMHVAKSIYGWQQKGKPDADSKLARSKLLQECYQFGSKLFEETAEHKAAIQKINKAIYDPKSEIQADWAKTRQWSLDYYAQLEELLGVKQKYHYLESQVWQKGLEIVKQHVGTVFEESEGAIVFRGEKYGLHTRVFITKAGTPTYEAKDFGLAAQKMQDWPFDLTLIPTACEQIEYFKVVIKALEEAMPELKGKLKHIGFGMISLSTGKMSSRKGNILSAPELIEEVITRVKKIVDKRENFSAQEKASISQKVALSAIKYAFLKSDVLKNKTFDINASIAFDGHSGPYLQYTYARCQSVMTKVDGLEKQLEKFVAKNEINAELTPAEQAILKSLYQFPEIIAKTAAEFAPHHLATYLFELAQSYNSFYRDHQILKAADEQSKLLRLALTQATAVIMKQGLELLGIEVVEKM